MDLKFTLDSKHMNPQDIPNHVKAIFNDKSMSMQNKMLAFMMFAPNIPDNPNQEDFSDLGKQVKQLIDTGKISLNGFDKDFNLNIQLN